MPTVEDFFDGNLMRGEFPDFVDEVIETYPRWTIPHNYARSLRTHVKSPTQGMAENLLRFMEEYRVGVEEAERNLSKKSIDPNTKNVIASNYMILWGTPELRDLEGVLSPIKNADGSRGEFFTPFTDLKSEFTALGKIDIDWEHRAGELGEEVLGYADLTKAELNQYGLWVPRVLDRHNRYVMALEKLTEAGIITNSTEAIDGKASKAANGEILAWPLYRDSFTVGPMEPRMKTENTLTLVKAAIEVAPELTDVLESYLNSGKKEEKPAKDPVSGQASEARRILEAKARAASLALDLLEV